MVIETVNFTRSRVDELYFVRAGAIVLKKLYRSKNIEKKAEISLAFVGDARMRALNKKYRGMNKTTDVLSFNYQDKIPPNLPLKKGGILLPPFIMEGWGGFLGEVIISVPQAKKQAEEQSYPLKRELLALFVHGILHLVGYEDEKKEDYQRMMKKQLELIKFLGNRVKSQKSKVKISG